MTNRELAERLIEAGNHLDISRFEELLTPDVVWDVSRSLGPFRGVYEGEAEVRPFLMSYVEVFENVHATPLEFYERGDWMAIDIHATMRGRGSGAQVEVRGARVHEFRDGKICRFVQFQNMDEAREYVDAQP